MNGDYSARTAAEPRPIAFTRPEPVVADYLVAVCAVCQLPGDVRPVRWEGLITYVHRGCFAQRVSDVVNT